MLIRLSITCLLLIASLGVGIAADVATGVSTRETYVGLPILLQIQVNNAVEHEEPEMPEVDGLTIESLGAPRRSSRVTIINGRRTERSTLAYVFRVTPLREGEFTIPPVKVIADGRIMLTKAVRIMASKSDTDDLMFVEIEGNENEIYVGEPLKLKLKIWLRPYRDRQLQVTLDEEDMWNRIADSTSWGLFGETIEQLAQDRRRPGGKSVLRDDSNGDSHEYYLYELDATVYPDRPGPIDADNVRIIVDYPVELGRQRSPFSMFDDDDFFGGSSLLDESFFRGFGSRIGVTKSRPIVAESIVDSILVKPVPQQGRPDDYQGAVGHYSIAAEGTPDSVKVGDPITLRIEIAGDGPLDRVLAPPLANQSDLAMDFKVPDEPLAGFVNQSTKIFSTTIRPKRADVSEIPPIAFSYFDPDKESFVTARSAPISIEVEEADVLALDTVVGTASQRRPSPASATSEVELLPQKLELAVYSDSSVLESVERPKLFSSQFLVWLLVPPLLCLALSLFRARSLFGFVVSARRDFDRRVARAKEPGEIAEATRRFLASRFRLTETDRDLTVGHLRARGDRELAIRVERLYSRCEKLDYRSDRETLPQLRREASEIVSNVVASTKVSKRVSSVRQLSSTSALVLVSLLPLSVACGEDRSGHLSLSRSQQQIVLTEAVDFYRKGVEGSEEAFARAAEKFQTIVDSGVQNDRLYFNLANAFYRSGETARAIANYRRALRLAPETQIYRINLALAEQNLETSQPPANQLGGVLHSLRAVALKSIPPSTLRWLLIASWMVLGLTITLRLLDLSFPWKSIAGLALVAVVITFSAYLYSVGEFVTDDSAVLVQPKVTLRESDGEEFAKVRTLSGAAGRVVRVIESRGDWTRIEWRGGVEGWIPNTTIETI